MMFSMIGNGGMNFNNLSGEGFAAFVLAIAFSIASIAGFIYFARHKELNKTISILITLAFPALSILFWVYLLLNLLAYDLVIALCIAFGCAVGYVVVALCIAFISLAIIKAKKNRPVESTEVEEVAEAQEQPVEEEQRLLVAPETVEDVVENEETEEKVETEDVVEENITPVEETPIEEGFEEETPADDDDDNNTVEVEVEEGDQVVVFANPPKKSFEEQFSELDEERKSYYNQILEYALSKQGTKCAHSKHHTAVKVGSMRVLDSKFARDALVCKFMAGSSELKNYSKKEKNVKIKEKPVIIEIDSPESVEVSKNMIDIVYKNISEAKEQKREEKRAKKLAQKQAEQSKNAENIDETPVVEENAESEE